jgi:hypothetical protein
LQLISSVTHSRLKIPESINDDAKSDDVESLCSPASKMSLSSTLSRTELDALQMLASSNTVSELITLLLSIPHAPERSVIEQWSSSILTILQFLKVLVGENSPLLDDDTIHNKTDDDPPYCDTNLQSSKPATTSIRKSLARNDRLLSALVNICLAASATSTSAVSEGIRIKKFAKQLLLILVPEI